MTSHLCTFVSSLWLNSFSHVLPTSPTWFMAVVNSDFYASPVVCFTFPLLPIGIEVKYCQLSRIKSYRGSFMPWFFLRASFFKSETKSRMRMLLYLFDCGSFRQDHGKSKFTIYVFLYNLRIILTIVSKKNLVKYWNTLAKLKSQL